MDESQHLEHFSMKNDYTDGQWVGGEFFYRKRKEQHHQTKEEALYGIFEESDSDEGVGKKRRRWDLTTKRDLTKPVNFVSTGIVQSVEESEKVVTVGDGDSERLGLGSGLVSKLTKGRRVEEEVIEDLLPTAFGRQIVEAAERKQKERERKVKEAASRALPTSDRVSVGGPDLGTFEKHTRGIGMKLLEKMGYKGGGLGKNQQGIAAPIEARLRPQKMGMGFKDFRETNSGLPPAPGQGEEPKDKIEKPKQKPKEKLWHVKNLDVKKKDHRTAAELLAEKQGSETVQTMLDMRGPVVRVLTNLENLNAEQFTKREDIPMPELQHNITLIVDLVQAEIQICDRKLLHGRDSVIILGKEAELLQKDFVSQKQQIGILETITSSIQDLQEKFAAGIVSLEDTVGSFASMQRMYREEYELYNIGVIVLGYLMPATVAIFRGWEPLQHPQHGVEVMAAWQGLLQAREQQDHAIFLDLDSLYEGKSSPYTQLVMEAIIPAVRTAATNLWEPRDPEPMLRFLDAWEKFLPSGVLQHILEHLIMPKLTVAVEKWDPRLETVPIHAWLHPWLPMLGSRMEPLYLPIRYKLTTALQAWHPKDSSAHTLLSPWQAVFDAASWEQLLVRSILPKLIYALQELVVNPAHQQLDQFNWVMAWATALPIHHMAGILEAWFFPKWQQILYQWLCNNPNFEEVTQWYLEWKSVFPSELLANERIRRQLNLGLEMMDQAVEGAPVVQPGARENVSYLRVTEQREFESQQHAAYQQQQQHAAATAHEMENKEAENLSLKEIVEGFAQHNDVQFMPKGRVHEGLQVYGFGTVSLCVDTVKQMIIVQTGDRWVSVSLEQLLGMHRSRSGSRWK